MFFHIGHKPVSIIDRRTIVSMVFRALPFVIGVIVFGGASADQRIPLTMAEAEDIALEDEPGQLSMQARAAALEQRALAAGELPDPALRVGLANYPIGDGDFSTEGMTQAQLGYRQSFPRRAVRNSQTSRLQHLAADMSAGAEGRSRDVLAAVRESWLDYYYWQRSIDVLNESIPYFESLVTTTRTFYGAGQNSQLDVLQAELELQYLHDRTIEAERARAAAQAALSQWLGPDAYRPLPNSLPNWVSVPSLEEIQGRLAAQPILIAADARIEAEESAVELAEANKKPGWILDVGYGYREGFLPSGEPRSDFVSVSVTVGLPMLAKNKHDRNLAAALANRSAAREFRRQQQAELTSQLRAEHTRWVDLSRRTTLYETHILDMSEASADAALLAYRSDAGDFSDVVRGSLDHLNTQLDYIRLKVERARTFAALDYFGGFSDEN